MSIPLPPSSGSAAVQAADPMGVDDIAGVGLWRGALRRLVRNPTAIVGAVIVSGFILVAICAPLLTPYQPGTAEWANRVSTNHVPWRDGDHFLGLDRWGSDLWTQLVYGARQSLIYGVVSTLIGLVVGTTLGALAGGFSALGGRAGIWVDTVIMRIVDIMLSIPSLLLAVSIVAVLGQNAYAVMIAIGMAQVPIFARLLRGSMLSQGKADYVLAASALGLRKRKIVMGHVLPNSIGPTIVQATLNLATAIIEVAALSYLGLGEADPAVAEWGRMLVSAQERFDSAPRLALIPGFAIAICALGFTLLGESMREALDPRGRR
ncbi:peptide/nickel transport system permease protein [Nocardioides daedukensis]|uniref:Peptide/nickel transport system permease protein n=1 Tax=Nocardioides daedukensis TaxID=634462 RepID=A0A7Y9S039_9ACTN|nr:peptide/nickel transport system permease protein [Nocardioides daedukensis]